MDYEMDRDDAEQPSLAEMTEAAIAILSRNPNGFYLLVEGRNSVHRNQLEVKFRGFRKRFRSED